MFSRKETREDQDDGTKSKETLSNEWIDKTKEYARLVHALSIQTLDEHLNLSVAEGYVNLERSEDDEYSLESEDVPLRQHKRKKDLWPIPNSLPSDTPIGPYHPQTSLTSKTHVRQQLDGEMLFNLDQHNVHRDVAQTHSISKQRQPIIRLYDYDVAHHLAIYENDLLRNTLERLIRQRLIGLGKKTRQPRGFVEALVLRDSLQLTEELLEIMGSLRDYLMQNLSNRMSSRLRPGNHKTVFRAARLIHLEESLLKRAQDRMHRILSMRTHDIEKALRLPDNLASDYSEEREANDPENCSFECPMTDQDSRGVEKSVP